MDSPQRKRQRKTPRDIAPNALLLPVKRACATYGLAYATFRQAIHRGELAVVKMGRSYYVRRAEVDRWLDANTERFGEAVAR